MAQAGQDTLRITVQEEASTIEFRLEGRLAGPWVHELSRVWRETIPGLDGKTIRLDLRNLTYSDDAGMQTLRAIVEESRAETIANSAWTQHLADELTNSKSTNGKWEA